MDLFLTEEEEPLGVSELVGLLQRSLETDFADVLVLGELSSFSTPASGHRYFTLADEGAAIDCVMWRSDAGRLAFRPEPGDEVVCRGRISIYPKQGRMQLYVSAMRPVGEGAAARALEALKRKLAAEGLFDEERKRALPFLPDAIGVVTSPTGAAVHDILTTLHRRFPHLRVVISPAAVQGAEAPQGLVEALALLAKHGGIDVAIIGRGGGASEDLAAFNDEGVVRAVADFPLPIVSAVGHEVDVSLCDLAADLRAATPTAAAEAVVPVHADLVDEVDGLGQRLGSGMRRYLENKRHHVAGIGGRLRDPTARVAEARQTVDQMSTRLERSLGRRHRLASTRFAALESKLAALNPLAVLERGYSLVQTADGGIVRSSAEIERGDELRLRFSSGTATAEVLDTSDKTR